MFVYSSTCRKIAVELIRYLLCDRDDRDIRWSCLALTFDFDLEDDLNNSFDAILPQELSAVPSTDDESGGSILQKKSRFLRWSVTNRLLYVDSLINLIWFGSAVLRSPRSILVSPITLPAPAGGTSEHTHVRRDLFDMRFNTRAGSRHWNVRSISRRASIGTSSGHT